MNKQQKINNLFFSAICIKCLLIQFSCEICDFHKLFKISYFWYETQPFFTNSS